MEQSHVALNVQQKYGQLKSKKKEKAIIIHNTYKIILPVFR